MSFLFGFSKKDITPGFPTCLACSQQKDTLFERVHDRIFVRCMVLKNNDRYTVILSYDLLFHSRKIYDFVYHHINKIHNIKRSDILINYTHDHNAPSVLGYNDFSASDRYEEILEEKTIMALNEAFDKLEPGIMEHGYIAGDWNINRRKPTDDGIKLAPNPSGPADKNLYILKLTDHNKKIKGLIINYACHPVHYPDTLGLTSEYPGYLCRYIQEALPGCSAMFLQGAGADTRPLGTVEGDHFVHRSLDYIKNMVSSISSIVIKKLNTDVFSLIEPSFKSINFNVDIPVENAGIDYFKDACTDVNLSAHLRRNAEYVYRNYDELPDSFTLECGLIQLSRNLLIVHMGGEPVCEVKFMLENVLKGYDIIFAGYTDACAYIVTDEMIDEGGYEVRCFLEYMHKGKIKKGIDNLISSAFKDALNQLV